ncbi:MAG: orotate phosphoribosyltransferase [Rhodobacteraceae bacterium]|nr:orotate phosphoribosyltransferase [Paracoccaceae bacterium]
MISAPSSSPGPSESGSDSLSQEAALAEFRAAGALLEGNFLLSSGLHSGVYLQCARVMMDPDRGERLCKALAEKISLEQAQISDLSLDLCVSPAMGAVIVGYETARHLGLRSMFMERPEGVFELRRGFEMPEGARCLMIEDVVTTGKSSRECIKAIENSGGRVVGAACLVDRSGGAADLGTRLTSLIQIDAPTYSADNLPLDLASLPAVKPGSRAALDLGSKGS